jgi:hypothetical protein
MNEVVTPPARNCGELSSPCRKPMFVATPRIRNSAIARAARSTAEGKSRPRQVSLVSRESKWPLITAPV